jgi:predicted RNA-binding Zn-ribbon protein involved in translation (DUF1610 family)
MNDPTMCPNCGRTYEDLTEDRHTESGCFLGMLIGVLEDRDVAVTHDSVAAAVIDIDGLWDRYGGPAADDLERMLGKHEHRPAEGSRNRVTAETVVFRCHDCGEFYSVAE